MTPEPKKSGWGTCRRWASWAVLGGTTVLALLFLGSGALTLARGATGAQGGLLDLRAFAPVSQSKSVPTSKRGASAETDRLDVRLTVWENTDDRRSHP